MEKYRFSAEQRSLLEGMKIPLAVFQYLEQRIVPLVFSDGFCAMLGYEGPGQAYLDLERDLFLDIHNDDKSMVAASALRAVRGDGHFDVVYRTKRRNGPDHRIIHAKGEPMWTEDGVRLEQVWYTDEGTYSENDGEKSPKLNDVFSRVIRENTIARAERAQDTSSEGERNPAGGSLEEEFQRLADLQEKACSILSVEKGPDGTAGEIRIVRANRAYKEAMGTDRYYDNMPYHELVPKVQRFEDSCYRCAIGHQQLHSYLQTRGSDFWTDQMLIPLRSEREDLGYCMFVMEMSRARNREQLAAVSIHTASTVLKASIALLGTNDLKERVETVLGDIMEFSGAFSVRILLVDHPNRRAINYCDRMAEEMPEDLPAPPEDPDRAVISYPMICSWEDTVGDASSLVVTSPEEMDELEARNPAWVRSLRPYQVERLILVPLRHDREITGYLYLCNFDPGKTEETREVSELLSFFLSTEIYNEVLLERLDDLSHTDALTGLNNRNAMIQRTGLLGQGGETLPFGVVNLDLNGLKRVNDDFGHEAGDRLLISASEMLKKHFYQEDLYRTGGDEFIVIATGITRETFERKVERLRTSIRKDGRISFAIGTCWSDGTIDVPTAFRRADELMYADKKAFYELHPELNR